MTSPIKGLISLAEIPTIFLGFVTMAQGRPLIIKIAQEGE
jgi:hypothetical protein